MQGVIIVLLIHIIVCVAVMMIRYRHKELALENLMPIVLAVPLFGALCFLLRWSAGKRKKLGGRPIGLDQEDVMNGRYMQIRVEEADADPVPLEEALLVNNESVHHDIMMGIIHSHPNEDAEILLRASSSEDVEVTHYAATMMMELMTEHEKKLQEYELRYQENQEPELLLEYISCFYEWIHSKLIENHIEYLYRQRLGELLEQYEKKTGSMGKLLLISVENHLELGENEKALEQLKAACKAYPEDERVYRLYGYYFEQVRDGPSFQKMVRDIKNQDCYLSRNAREWLTFWS